MSESRWLITGGSGQLGRELARLLPGSYAPGKDELSVTDLDRLREQIARTGATTVFNCAAYNAVDRAEQESEVAMEVNADGASNVARACRLESARLVHFSTNYVFDGLATDPYTEADEPRPTSAYGRSKLDGERRVLAELPEALVVRSAGLFGPGGSAVKGGSFPDRLLARAKAGQPLAVVIDQRLNPTYTGHLAEATIRAAAAGTTGLLHLVASGCCSFHEFALEVLKVAGVMAPVKQIVTSPGGTARPRNGCLASIRAEPLPSWREGLAAYWLTRSASVA
jgi:dTDP-4-dehydrorhamnose reductase